MQRPGHRPGRDSFWRYYAHPPHGHTAPTKPPDRVAARPSRRASCALAAFCQHVLCMHGNIGNIGGNEAVKEVPHGRRKVPPRERRGAHEHAPRAPFFRHFPSQRAPGIGTHTDRLRRNGHGRRGRTIRTSRRERTALFPTGLIRFNRTCRHRTPHRRDLRPQPHAAARRATLNDRQPLRRHRRHDSRRLPRGRAPRRPSARAWIRARTRRSVPLRETRLHRSVSGRVWARRRA